MRFVIDLPICTLISSPRFRLPLTRTHSSTSPPHPPTTTSTPRATAGTQNQRSTAPSMRTPPPSGSSPTRNRNPAKTSYSRCSPDALSSPCNRWSGQISPSSSRGPPARTPGDLLFARSANSESSVCIARTVNAMHADRVAAPIVQAMEVSNRTFVLLKHFPLFRKMLFSLPPWLAVRMSPETAGLMHLPMMLKK